MDVFNGEDARTLAGFEVGATEKVAVTTSLKILMPSVDVFDGEDARTLAGFEVGSTEKVVVTISLRILVPADEDDVIGGNPEDGALRIIKEICIDAVPTGCCFTFITAPPLDRPIIQTWTKPKIGPCVFLH